MMMVASLSATYYVLWIAKKKGLSQVIILDLAMIGTLMGVIGARLFHVFFEAFPYYLEDPIRVFYVWQGGFVGYGSFLGILFGTVVYLLIRQKPILEYCDVFVMGCPLIVMAMRIGCLGAGCCYGKPTDFFIHLVFNHPASDAGRDFPGVALHATQIYDFLSATFILALLYWVDKRKKFHGQILLLFFAIYAFNRFLIEFIRGDVDRGVYFDGMISTSQITGVVFLVFIFILWPLFKKLFPVNKSS